MDAVIRSLHIKAIDNPEFAPQYQATIDRLQAADAAKAARAHIQAGFAQGPRRIQIQADD